MPDFHSSTFLSLFLGICVLFASMEMQGGAYEGEAQGTFLGFARMELRQIEGGIVEVGLGVSVDVKGILGMMIMMGIVAELVMGFGDRVQ